MKKAALRVHKRTVMVEAQPDWAARAESYALALRACITALSGLDFDDRRRVTRWVCDTFGIDPTKL